MACGHPRTSHNVLTLATQLDIVLTSLNDEPENAELLALKAELDEMIKMINESIGDIAPSKRTATSSSTAAAKAPTPPPPAPEKWSRENHPAFRKQAQEEKDRAEAAAQQAAAEAAPVHYAVNDTVLAKWVSGDKGFYAARITAVTGSSTQPIYTVKFKSYDTVETLRSKDIKPVGSSSGGNGGGSSNGGSSSSSSSGNKRKADGVAAASSSAADASPTGTTPGASSFSSASTGATASNNGIVLQSAPSVYPQAEQQPADGEKPAKKFKKIKATKELEKGKSKWQEFTTKGKFGKAAKKDSMFRTPEGVHGRGTSPFHPSPFLRPACAAVGQIDGVADNVCVCVCIVGFTGSGQAMRKDPTRSRHIYQPNEDID